MYHKSVAVRLAYGSMSLFIAILHNVFLLYYVDIFVSVYKIDRNSFWLGEVGAFVFVSSGLFCCLMKTMFCLWKIRPGTLNKIWICKIFDKKITHLRCTHQLRPFIGASIALKNSRFYSVSVWNSFLRVSIKEKQLSKSLLFVTINSLLTAETEVTSRFYLSSNS